MQAADVEFYATVAQVIPVLVLALVFEVRFFEKLQQLGRHWAASLNRAYLAFALIVAAAGEVACLSALRSGTDSTLHFWLATLGVLVPLVLVFLRLLLEVLFDSPWGWSRLRDISPPPPAADPPG